MFCRFICGTILHLSLLDEVTKGLLNMKFASKSSVNQIRFFLSWPLPYCSPGVCIGIAFFCFPSSCGASIGYRVCVEYLLVHCLLPFARSDLLIALRPLERNLFSSSSVSFFLIVFFQRFCIE